MIRYNRRFTFVPTASGFLARRKAPDREMFAAYSARNSSTEANSWLIVTRSSRGTSFRLAFAIAFVGLLSVRLPALLLVRRFLRLPQDVVLLHMVARPGLDEHP